ncbi:MAG TPA: hypothetical protein VFL14_00315 [Xanthomonadales bacterium]|nr:hypothetical protein [Xanthomonadales bacterium]
MTRGISFVLLALGALVAPDARTFDGPIDRAYPPSCLSYPLPPVEGPVYQSVPPIPGVAFFRRACSGGRSALLVALGTGSGETNRAMPSIVAAQSGSEFPLRAARSPNTITEDVETFDDTAGEVFVLELPRGGATLNLDLELVLRVQYGTDEPIVVVVPAFQPPASPARLAVSRYATGSWYDPAHPGEGIFLEVGENGDGSTFVFFSWFTYDSSGAPYWLVGQGTVIEGQPSVVVPVRTFRGGRFAGAFDPAQVQGSAWGEVEFSFPSCTAMTLRYAGTGTTPGTPSGSGIRQWARLVSVKGLACE